MREARLEAKEERAELNLLSVQSKKVEAHDFRSDLGLQPRKLIYFMICCTSTPNENEIFIFHHSGRIIK
jgi:hypothetical protein